MEVADIKRVKHLPLDKYLSASKEDYEVTVDAESSSVTVSFDKNKLQVSDVVEQMLKHVEVKDIKIKETELAEIVMAIYNHDIVQEG